MEQYTFNFCLFQRFFFRFRLLKEKEEKDFILNPGFPMSTSYSRFSKLNSDGTFCTKTHGLEISAPKETPVKKENAPPPSLSSSFFFVRFCSWLASWATFYRFSYEKRFKLKCLWLGSLQSEIYFFEGLCDSTLRCKSENGSGVNYNVSSMTNWLDFVSDN